MLCLHVNRCNMGTEGLVKSTRHVDPEPRIMFPVFCNNVHAGDAQQLRYRRTVAILHIGPRSTEGHYRSIFNQPERGRQLITNDNQPACVLSPDAH